jgi:hypothetical protein
VLAQSMMWTTQGPNQIKIQINQAKTSSVGSSCCCCCGRRRCRLRLRLRLRRREAAAAAAAVADLFCVLICWLLLIGFMFFN